MTTPTETPTPPLRRYVAIIDLDGYIAVEESPDGSLTDYGVAIDRIERLERQLTAATAQLEIYRQETHRWSEAHRAVEAGELKRLAERFQCAPEHAATAALAFATTTETPLTSALFASLPAYTQETLKFMPLCEKLEKKLTAATAQLEEARKVILLINEQRNIMANSFGPAVMSGPVGDCEFTKRFWAADSMISSLVQISRCPTTTAMLAAMQQKEGK